MSAKSKTLEGNVLLVANWPSDVGYAWWLMESYWVAISKHLSSNKVLLAYPQINKVPSEIQSSAIDCLPHNFKRGGVIGLIRNCRLIRRHHIKLIYLTDYPLSSISYFFYRISGVKFIITHDHTPGIRCVPQGLKKAVKTLFANLPLMSVDGAFGATLFVTERLQNTGCLKKDKCFTVQNGIEIKGDESINKAAAWLPKEGDFAIVTAARANRYKGGLFALRVIKCLKDRGMSNVKYVFCGDGPHLDDFKNFAAELGLQEHCFFPGRVEDVSSYFSHFSIGFQPSNGEVGYSLSILEYMAAGLPVIVPNNPSVCGATKHNCSGRIYKDRDVESAANQIEFYAKDTAACNKHGQFAREEIFKRYALVKTHEALIKSLNAVISSK
ncbi:glycosyltransferase family 4 protein [Alteromonas sp. S167]|uniref:glycosyltransferase family 4 protein n=1 Tax=Alteromonas sp. S167 TaxID=3117402 RepID=UPI002FE0342D